STVTPRESATTADRAPLATSLPSATIACLSCSFKAISYAPGCLPEKIPATHFTPRNGESVSLTVSRNKPEYKRIILAFCHRLRRGLSFLRNSCGLRRRPG